MLSTPHVIVGAAIALAIPTPIVAIPLAFASHLVLEMIPHWNPHLNTEMKMFGHLTASTKVIIFADSTLAVISALFIASRFGGGMYGQSLVLGSSLAAIAPDLMEAPYFFLHIRNRALTSWLKFQKSIQSDAGPVLGMATQLVVVVGVMLALYIQRFLYQQ